MTICIIPARSGSKRIKNKNIKSFNGKPIISYAIKLAKSSKLFDRVIVSTDSKKIAKIAKKYGAEVPFLRSKKLSNDYATTAEVIEDCIKKISSEKVKYHFCLYPTTTLISKKNLVEAFKKIKKNNSDLLVCVTDFDSNPFRSYKLLKNNKLKFFYKKYRKYRTQDLPKLFHDAGSFYIYKTLNLFKNKGKITNKSTYYYLERDIALDIDDKIDFKLAELLFKNKK